VSESIRWGSVWWVDLGEPRGSEPGFVRPALIISADSYNRSAIATVTVAVITSNFRLAAAPGNVRLGASEAGLPKESVVNVTQVATVDKAALIELAGELDDERMAEVATGLRKALAL
jgi:mRNA interferase MazF